MRNRVLGNAARVLEMLQHRALTRAELEAELRIARCELSRDALTNLLLDLRELGWIERRAGADGADDEDRYRLGITMALYWRRALDAEKREMKSLHERVCEIRGEE